VQENGRPYIEAVRAYNTELKTFPGMLWAATFFRSNKPMAEFQANDDAHKLNSDPARPSARARWAQSLLPLSRALSRTGACLALSLLMLVAAAFAANFPALTSRVVDQANIIQPESRRAIEAKLAGLETKSGIQLVVATVTSLDGQEIEPYANCFASGSSVRRPRTMACFCSSLPTNDGYG
jgi:hypothetical protein